MGLPQAKMALDAFIEWENAQSDRHFFYRGEVFAMVGVRQAHACVTLNLGAAFKSALRGTPCRVFVADMKLRIEAADALFYPDVMVSCDGRDKTTPFSLSHPKLIVEVLSESTAAFDRGLKFAACRAIDALQEYALVDVEAHAHADVMRGLDGLSDLDRGPGLQLEAEIAGRAHAPAGDDHAGLARAVVVGAELQRLGPEDHADRRLVRQGRGRDHAERRPGEAASGLGREAHGGAEEIGDELVDRALVELVRRAALDQPAGLHDVHPIAGDDRLLGIVGDQQRRDPRLLEDAQGLGEAVELVYRSRPL